MKKVLLINPPAPFLAFPNAGPAMGIGYLLVFLKQHGVEVEYLNLEGENPFGIELREGYDFYGFTAMTPQYPYAVWLMRQVKSRKLGKTIIGGAHASVAPHECLNDGFDFVVKGFGEKALLQIVKGELKEGIIQGAPLDDINFPFAPDWEALWMPFDVSFGRRTGHIITMRGCPFGCNFCSSRLIYGPRATCRKVDNVIEEVKLLVTKFGVTDLYFYDTCFTFNPKRAIAIAKALGRLGIPWACQTRVDLVNPELLRIMQKGGCVQISFGVETGSSVLDSLGKNTSAELNASAINMCHDAGVAVKAFLMVGLPGETSETVQVGLEFLFRNPPDQWHLSTFQALPGTCYFESPKEFGLTLYNRDPMLAVPLGLNGRGPVNHRTAGLSRTEVVEARNLVLSEMMRLRHMPRIENAMRRYLQQKGVFDRCLQRYAFDA